MVKEDHSLRQGDLTVVCKADLDILYIRGIHINRNSKRVFFDYGNKLE
jgi:hypothetical protein